MSNSRKYQRYFKPISKEQFSSAGTIRSQGRVGQTSLSQSYSRTPCIGTSPVGHGGHNGKYYNNLVFSCCSSSNSQGQSSKTTKGLLLSTVTNPTSVYNTTCTGKCGTVMIKDFSPETHSQSALLQRKNNKNMQQNWSHLKGTHGKYCHCASSYHIGGRLFTNEPYAKTVTPMSSGEYLHTQYLYKNKTEDCC
jgi:hypothetical protein